MATHDDLVLITGCGSGIGKALARAFHAAGWRVCATARRPETIADLAGAGMLTLPLDVTSDASIAQALDTLRGKGLRIGTLVNNAGYGSMGPLLDIPGDEWKRQFDVNVFAPMALARAVLPDMIARRSGLIVNVSSISGVTPTPFAGPYCASKAALTALSDSLRMELAPFGVRVVTVQPGGIRTSFGDNASKQVTLADDSPYQAYRESVLARASASQERATPAEDFARDLVRLLANPRCPAVVRLGEKSTWLPAVKRWLPTRVLDRLLSKRFGLG